MEFKYKDIVFNNKLVLNKGCIEFNKGQITIITGESGSGKTTLFRLMTKGNDGWKDLDLYQKLFQLVKDKDYFVLTTNVDHCFQKANFDKQRLFYTQGDYGLFQCSSPCHQETYDNEELIKKMIEQQKDMKIPTSLIPYCPHCGKPMTMNLRCDDTFVEDEGWHQAYFRYQDFIRRHQDLKIVYLELGVGQNTPGIIKYPFFRFVERNKNATYICINKDTYCPQSMEKRAYCISEDIKNVIDDLLKIKLEK